MIGSREICVARVTGDRGDRRPRTAIVVGAGIVGLSTAWFLQQRGVEVIVLDRDGVAAGASGGNAGWITPGLVALHEPAALRYGMRSSIRLIVSRHFEPCRKRKPCWVCWTGWRRSDSPLNTRALARSVIARGGEIRTEEVVDIRAHRGGVQVHAGSGSSPRADVAVIATGALLSRLARHCGVLVPARTSRGYSFTVAVDRPVRSPIYLPEAHVTCTPDPDGMRVAVMAEQLDPNEADTGGRCVPRRRARPVGVCARPGDRAHARRANRHRCATRGFAGVRSAALGGEVAGSPW